MNLTGNAVLITGGATGIGFALAEQFSSRGNQVIVCGRSEEALQIAKTRVPALIARVCDITRPDSRRAMLEWLRIAHPDLNILINNAGVQHRRDFNDVTALRDLDQEVAINFTAPVHLIGELLPLLRRQRQSVIVNVTSGLAFAPLADVPVYCATKAALHSFTLSLRHQLKPLGVRVVEMAPPIVDTGLGAGSRSGGTADQTMMAPETFATEALAMLEGDQDEVLIGHSVGTRKMGEALFERMNRTTAS